MRKVFLSSTARDLTAYRDAVATAIDRLDGFQCVRMENFGARAAPADEFCRANITESDVAVFIVGLCYGSSPEGIDQSYTVREYEAAKEADKPRLVFLSAEGKSYEGFDPTKREPDAIWNKQKTFRDLLNQELIRDEFTTPVELAGKVATALSNWAQGEQGNQTTAAIPPAQRALRNDYLNRVMERCGYLSLAGIDPAAAQSDDDRRLNLNAVYTALLTRSPRQEEGRRGMESLSSTREEQLLSALEQLDRHPHLVLQGDPGSGKSTFVNFVASAIPAALEILV